MLNCAIKIRSITFTIIMILVLVLSETCSLLGFLGSYYTWQEKFAICNVSFVLLFVS